MIKLKVLEAYTRDVGRGVARIDYETMDKLQVSTGDMINVKYNVGGSVFKVVPLYPSDEGKGIIRIDGLGRNNIGGVLIGIDVELQNIKCQIATKVTVKPLEAIPPIDEKYLADALDEIPVRIGNNVVVPYFGGRLTFQVISTEPSSTPVIIKEKHTIFTISEKDKENDMTLEEKAKRFDDLHRVFKSKKIDLVEFNDQIQAIEKENEELKNEIRILNDKISRIGGKDANKEEVKKLRLKFQKMKSILND